MLSDVRLKYIVLIIFIGLIFFSCGKASENNTIGDSTIISKSGPREVEYSNDKIQYEGRVEIKSGEAAYLYWPGTIARVKFYGTGISVTMQDDSINDEEHSNCFYIIVDGNILEGKLKIDKEKKSFTLVENLPEGEHVIELFKLNAMKASRPIGYAKLYKFELIGDGNILKPEALKPRKMEFYGNSITVGVSNEVGEGELDNFGSKHENNYLSYGAITARHFHAQYRCIAQSGIGLMQGVSKPTMPQMYNRLNPFNSESQWDFSKYMPDVVVINLLQNDASRLTSSIPNNDIIKRYQEFILSIRRHYPNAYIICTLGPMSAANMQNPKWRQIMINACNGLKDSKVSTMIFPYMKKSGHPRIVDHEEMSKKLIDFIDRNIKW